MYSCCWAGDRDILPRLGHGADVRLKRSVYRGSAQLMTSCNSETQILDRLLKVTSHA
jgi:hypothetical protein